MSKSFTLYWSSLATYENCPQSFLWGRGWGNIDVGGGPGRAKPKPFQKSEHHAVMGTVIQGVIEKFYNDELWRLIPPAELPKRLMTLADETLHLELTKRFVDWRLAGSPEELEKTIKDGIAGYLRTMKAHKLLGVYSRAEVELLAYVNKYCPIGGRADVIIRREDTGTLILDGKNGKRYKDSHGVLMTYTDPDQLRWYALCYYLAYKVMPDRLAFVYYRYPYGDPALGADGKDTGEKELGVTWVTFTRDDLKGLAQRAVDVRRSMDKEKFGACPSPKTCRFCDYETVCPERITQKEGNKRGVRTTTIEALKGDSGGITILKLDD